MSSLQDDEIQTRSRAELRSEGGGTVGDADQDDVDTDADDADADADDVDGDDAS